MTAEVSRPALAAAALMLLAGRDRSDCSRCMSIATRAEGAMAAIPDKPAAASSSQIRWSRATGMEGSFAEGVGSWEIMVQAAVSMRPVYASSHHVSIQIV